MGLFVVLILSESKCYAGGVMLGSPCVKTAPLHLWRHMNISTNTLSGFFCQNYIVSEEGVCLATYSKPFGCSLFAEAASELVLAEAASELVLAEAASELVLAGAASELVLAGVSSALVLSRVWDG